ncbi:MAG: thioesterase family protein [Candidatus Omnitrophica bacterium]|nr:thioesterase family protein [Candidatus Omnitrophota bacterium]
MKKRIYYHDTDCGGVVYYANYLKFMEEARTESWEERGVFLKELIAQGTLFVVAHQEIDYKCPAFYGDILEVSAKLVRMSAVKLEYEHEVRNQNSQLICVGKAVLVCVDNQIKPKSLPDDVRGKLNANA